MTGSDVPSSAVPPDPTFSPAAYEQVARLLRSGVIGFLILATVGMVAELILSPSETVSALLVSHPATEYGSAGDLVGALGAGYPDALIILGIYLMVAVTVGRVVLATADLYRGGERALGTISAAVVALLLVGLFVVAPLVR